MSQLPHSADKIAVLLVEDKQGEAEVIRQALRSQAIEPHDDLRVTPVGSLADAMLRLGRESVDIVLLDLNLPDAKGIKAVKAIHGQYPALPMIVLSGQTDSKAITEAVEAGARQFLAKGEASGKAIKTAIYQALAQQFLEEKLRNHRGVA